MKLAPFYERIAPFLEGRQGLEETQRALYGPTLPRDAQRLAIYQRFCREHRNTATGGVHQVLRGCVIDERGESGWRALVEAYFVAHPMQHVEINENGAQLAAFLANRSDVPEHWAALADFEWWEWQTFIARDDPADDDVTLPLRIASTVEVRPYRWNFVDWFELEPRPSRPALQDVLVLFWRNRRLEARRAVATMDELQLLKRVSEGLPVEKSETFADLLAAGILLGSA
jgi:hypothetical protein